MSVRLRSVLAFGLAVAALAACQQMKATTDRAFITLSLKPACPEPVEGRAAGAETPEAALGCFRHAITSDSASMMLRVTCHGRTAASCKQNDATTKDAEKVMTDLKKVSWTNVLGKWSEGDKTTTFAVDTQPGEKRVTTVVTCKIVDADKWAVCEIGDMSRDAADQKVKSSN